MNVPEISEPFLTNGMLLRIVTVINASSQEAFLGYRFRGFELDMSMSDSM